MPARQRVLRVAPYARHPVRRATLARLHVDPDAAHRVAEVAGGEPGYGHQPQATTPAGLVRNCLTPYDAEMPDLNTLAPQQLFKQWRSGDAASGQAMAQRFSDWYYAVTAARLGDQHGRTPLQRACTRFQQGIVGVTNPADLSDWAHGILSEELRMAGGRIPGGDFANQLTGGKLPSEILARARDAMPPAQVRLLAHAYDARYPFERVTKEAEVLGGMPFAVLDARYALKRWLKNEAGVRFAECPDKPNLDYAPLPLYEAGRMGNANEENGFEKWMLQNMPLCKDIAEFGVFALSLRNGAFATPVEPEAPKEQPKAARTPEPEPAPTPEFEVEAPRSYLPYIAVGVVILLIFTVVAAAVVFGLFHG